ncbi:hypothetical protein AB0N06_34500 [Streptomyces sp. NPDC051020]|uniref:hypothetical protein n=1 Tax=Streptomyces sp. NPDC051020 TaxID=3155409 RepID=UPI00342F49A6
MTVTDAWNGPIGLHWADHPDRYNAMLARFDEPLFDSSSPVRRGSPSPAPPGPR